MKDKFDVLFSKKESDIEYIADNYKAVSDKDKEKIYDISKRKYNILKSEEKESVTDDFIKEAEGVERYSRPVWYRWVCASAACVMIAGAISGGVMLARNHKKIVPLNQYPTSEVSTQVTTADIRKNTDPNDMDGVMDELLTSWVKIQNAQFGKDAAENEELKYELSSDVIAPEEYVYSYTYHKVTEDGAKTFDDFDKMLSSTYSEYVYDHLMGGDMSQYESGTRFGEETDEGRAVRHFIKYGNSAYARWSPDYKFTNMCDFENYDLVSSEFKDSADEFDYKSSAFCEWYSGEVYALKFTSAEFYEAFEEKFEDFVGIFDSEYDDVALCQRVYKSKDGDAIVNADFLLVKQGDSWKIANFVIKSDNMEIELPTDAVTTTTVSTDDAVVTTGLQVHEQTIFKTYEEAEKAVGAINEKFRSGQYKFEKLDTDKYINNIVNAGEGLDNPDYKNYIYHLLWNSYRYFDTAEVEYKSINNDNNIFEYDINVSVDNREKYMRFNLKSSAGTENSYYQNGKNVYEVNDVSKTYFKYEISDDHVSGYDYYIPENLRVIYVDVENGLSLHSVLVNYYYEGFANDCLFPEGTNFNNFDDWNIVCIDQYLGRVCAGVELGKKDDDHVHFIIDLKTGIILKRIDYYANGEERAVMEVKSIKLDVPIENKIPDLSEYTEEK